MALIWFMLYLLVAQVTPAAFNGLKSAFWYDNFSDLVYFSFISLTTIGYGDVTPAVSVAHFLAYMEGIVGQFYIAIVVASLVGARMSDKDSGQ